MDLRHLRSFAAVARTTSFTAAAAELGYTQSAVSQHVAALEREVGRPLLARRPVRLTPAGEQLAAHAEQILLRVDTARTEMARVRDRDRTVRVAAAPGAVLRPLLAALRASAPEATIEVAPAAIPDALRLLGDGGADGAVIDGITVPAAPVRVAEPGLFRHRLVAELPLDVLMPAGHPLAGLGGVDLATVADARWIDAPNLPCGPAAIPDAPPVRAGARLRYLGTDAAAVAGLVADGAGLALMPRGAAPPVTGLTAVPLRTPGVVHRTELLVRASGAGAGDVLTAAAERLASASLPRDDGILAPPGS
ncbi:MAG: LysR family transcriptional regulator [Thermoleophilia bacterium]